MMANYDGSLKFDTKIDDKGFKKGLSKLQSVGGTVLGGIAKATAVATTAITAMGVASIKVGSDFEAGMSRVAALSGATAMEFEKLEKTALDLGKTTVFSATQASEAMSYLAMAGFKTNDIIDAMPGLLDAAAAGQTDLGIAADITSNILSGFGIEARESGRVADVLTKAFTSSNTSLESLGETMKYAGPVARAAGFSLEETAAAAGLLGDAGIQGSQAGTTLRGVMLRLVNPPKQAAEALNELGVSLTDAQGEMKSFPDIIQELERATEGMTDAQRTAIISQIAGQNAASGLLAIMDAGSDTLREFGEELENSAGTAAEIAAKQLDNLQGDVKLLESAMEGAGIAIYKQFDKPLRDATQAATGYVAQIEKAISEGGFEGMADAVGDILADVLKNISNFLPKIVDMATTIMKSFASSIRGNRNEIARSIVSAISGGLEAYIEMVPEFMAMGVELISGIIAGISESVPDLMESMHTGLVMLLETIRDSLPEFIHGGVMILVSMLEGIGDMIPDLIDLMIDIVIIIADELINNIDLVIDAGIQIMFALVQAIMDNLPKLIENVPRIINEFTAAILEKLPELLMTGIKLLVEIGKGLIQAIPTLIANIPQIIMAIINAFTLSSFLNLGKNIISSMGKGISGMTGNIAQSARNLGRNLIQAFKDILSGKSVLDIGSNLVKGIWSGIKNVQQWILNQIKGFGNAVLKGIKGVFGIKSPSRVMRDEIGKNLALGIGVGFEAETGDLTSDIDKEMERLTRQMQATVDMEAINTGNRIAVGTSQHRQVVVREGQEGLPKEGIVHATFVTNDREIAKATAPYTSEELEMERKRGWEADYVY